MNRFERIKNWANNLSEGQAKLALAKCVDDLMDMEYLRFYDEDECPYHDTTGEDLVDE